MEATAADSSSCKETTENFVTYTTVLIQSKSSIPTRGSKDATVNIDVCAHNACVIIAQSAEDSPGLREALQ